MTGPTDETSPLSPTVLHHLMLAADSQTLSALLNWQAPGVEEVQRALPHYQISRLLGRGGMGAVYLGEQTGLGRKVAVKLLPAELHDDELDYTHHFRQEASLMAQLSHPNIVAVFDSGETEEGLLYFVMEHVEGEDVGHLMLREGRLPLERALDIARAVGTALAYAHRHGIGHHDIKPSNVMLEAAGGVKVTDFGLAKIMAVEAPADLAAGTGMGMIFGTPGYAAPELFVSGARVDHRADLYSLGVMLFQMLTGVLPPAGWERQRAALPADRAFLRPLLIRAMQSDPAQRHATAEEFLEQLRRVRKPLRLERRRWLWLTGAACVPAVAAILSRSKESQKPAALEEAGNRPYVPGGPLFEPTVPIVGEGGWRSVFKEFPRLIPKMRVRHVEGPWYALNKGFVTFAEQENAAVRFTGRNMINGIIIVVRWSPDPVELDKQKLPLTTSYGFRVAAGMQADSLGKLFCGWIGTMLTVPGGQIPTTYRYLPPAGSRYVMNTHLPHTRDQPYELEVRCFGDKIVGLMNGQVLLELENPRLPGRWIGIQAGGPTEFRDLDWRPLTPQGETL